MIGNIYRKYSKLRTGEITLKDHSFTKTEKKNMKESILYCLFHVFYFYIKTKHYAFMCKTKYHTY
jgi:hypothetical protein